MKMFKAVPWFFILALLKILFDHYSRLAGEDRERLGQVVRETKGVPGRFTPQHKQDLVDIATRVDKALLGRDLLGLASPLPLPKKK